MKKKRAKRQPVPKSEFLSLRVSKETLKQLDRYVEKLRREQPGGAWTRSSAAMNLIGIGLGSFAPPAPAPKAAKR